MSKNTDSCIICSNKLSIFKKDIYDTKFGIGGHFDIGCCNSCGLVQLKNHPSKHELKALYEKYYNFGGNRKGLYSKISEVFFTSYLYRLWIAIDGDICFYSKSGNGRLLDLGCNEGRGIAIYNKNGFNAEGLELNELAANKARFKGCRVFTALLEEFDPEYKYDIIVLSHVLEHSTEPEIMLSHVARLLKPGGQVWISCPNIKSLFRVIFGEFWINWHAPFHITFFSAETLKNLLKKNGFKVIKTSFTTPTLWITQSMIAFFFSRIGRKTNAHQNPILLGGLMLIVRFILSPCLWFCNFIGRGDCLTATACYENDQ